MSLPWSAKGSKATAGVAADEVMILDSEDATLATKNKRMGFQNQADSFLNLSSIAGLTDGTSTILSTALMVFEEGGSKFKASLVPNATTNFNISNETQLDAELGINHEIPDGDDVTITVLESFTLTEPFKIGLGSSLKIQTHVLRREITYTGAGAMFQNTNPANSITTLELDNIFLLGNTTNSVFDVIGTLFVGINRVQFKDFNSLGTISNFSPVITSMVAIDVNIGLVFINPLVLTVDTGSLFNSSATGITLFSVISDIAGSVTFTNIISPGIFAGDSLLFLDPNGPSTFTYFINQSPKPIAGDFFQQGSAIAIDSVADNTSGFTRFTTAASHGLQVGQVVVISGFATETTYNKTAIVTAVDTPVTGTTFDAEIAFVATDTGSMTEQSLDSTDLPVLAIGNPNIQDSMFTANAGLDLSGAPVTVVITTANTPEVITSTSWLFDDLERFTISTNDDGELTVDDTATRRYRISYSGSIERVAGGGQSSAGIIILKNGVNVTFNAPRLTISGAIVFLSGEDIVELTAGDTIQIGVINYATGADIEVTQISMVIGLA